MRSRSASKRLACSVDADVRLRCRRQHASQRVERLRPDRRSMHAFGVAGRLRVRCAKVTLHRGISRAYVSNARSIVST